MAGVIAMAADLGYNFFIVLSGTITNLREQTAKRLYGDLALINKKADPNLKMSWEVLDNLSPKSPDNQRLSSLKLSGQINGESNPHRYLTVCLKNKKRLRDLLGWLQMQDSLERTGMLKVVIIDDECDQAGVNTADVAAGEQTRIFQLIKGICDHAKPAPHDQVKPGARYKTANYIAYSATPYANILNDGDSETSLFPRDFICSLPMSPSYWGPSRFFGTMGEFEAKRFEAFPFVNEITTADLSRVREIHSERSNIIPPSLEDAVNWFICAGAVRRLDGSKKPVSMLVHTSNKTVDHTSVANVIEAYLGDLRQELAVNDASVLAKLGAFYEEQRKTISLDDFVELFPDYEPKLNSVVKTLPPFDDIKDQVLTIVKEKVSHIQLSGDATGHAYEFEEGIHLCVDNSASNAVQSAGPGEEFILRIKYPEEGQEVPCAPLFLIVGGNTLSRGLTLEGLVSSYFVRTVRQSDSLMQMGRWFGYRFDCELLPRVWMTERTLAKFCLLNQVDLDLRTSLREAMDAGLPPDQMIPCIRDTSDVIAGFTLTSPKKMQMAEVAEADYGGRQQVVVTFDTDDASLATNEKAVRDFLSSVTGFSPAGVYAPSNFVAQGLAWDKIKSLLQSCHFSEQGRDFRHLDLFCKFVEQKLGDRKWTVVVAGTIPRAGEDNFNFAEGLSVGKVGRKVHKKADSYIAFKHVTSPVDFVCDIDHEADCVPGTEPFTVGSARASVGYYRAHASIRGKDRNPGLIVNCISKNYLGEKCDVELTHDIFGLAFYFPKTSANDIGSYTKLRVCNLSKDEDSESEV